MIDHAGEDILVGWPDHHLVWIEAALTLALKERLAAYQDISDLTGRTFTAVRQKGYWLAEKRQAEQARIAAATSRRILVVDRGRGPNRLKLAPSQLTPVSKARLMGCR